MSLEKLQEIHQKWGAQEEQRKIEMHEARMYKHQLFDALVKMITNSREFDEYCLAMMLDEYPQSAIILKLDNRYFDASRA